MPLHEELADPKERVDRAAPMSQRFVLDPLAYLVDYPAGQPGHVEGIGHSNCMRQVWVQSFAVGVGQIQSDDADTAQPAFRAVVALSTHRGATFALEQVDDHATVKSTRGRIDGGVPCLAAR